MQPRCFKKACRRDSCSLSSRVTEWNENSSDFQWITSFKFRNCFGNCSCGVQRLWKRQH